VAAARTPEAGNTMAAVRAPDAKARGRLSRLFVLPFAVLLALGLQPLVAVMPAFAASCTMTESWTTVPSTAIAGSSFSVTVTVSGSGGGGPTCAGSVTLSSSTDTHFTAPASQSYSFTANGSHPLTYTVTLITAGAQTITATNTPTTGTCGTSCSVTTSTITVSAGTPSASNSTISTSSSSPTAGGTAPTITVTLKDGTAAQNLVSGKAVSLTGLGTNATATAVGGATSTNSSGQIQFTVSDTVAESLTIGAQDTSDSVTLSSTVSVTYQPGALDHFNVAATSPQTAGTGFTVTATAQDVNNNTVTSFASTVALSDAGDSGFSNPSTTAAGGVATFSNVVLHTAGSSTITATGSSKTGSVTITVNPGALSSFSFSSPGAQTAGTSFSLTVTAKDAFSNTKTNYTGTVSFSTTDSKSTVANGGLPGSYTFVTSDSGAHTFTFTLNTAGTQTIAVTDSSAGVSTTSSGITVNAGAVSGSASTIGQTGSPVTADGSSSVTITVTLLDSHSNGVSGRTVQLSGLGASTPSPGTSTSTNSSGQAVFTLTDTTAQTLTIGATDTTDSVTLSHTVSVQFTAGAASAAHSSVSPASQTGVTADGSTAATITVTVEDANSNPISGDSVTLTASGGSSVINTSPTSTNSSGQAVFQITDTMAEGPLTYTAKDASASNLTLGTATVTFSAGAVSTSNSSVTGPSGSVLADGTTTGTITVTLKDAHNNAISNANVLLQANGGSSLIGTTAGTTGVTTATGTNGVATFTVKDAAAETLSYTATDTTAVPNVTIGSVSVTFAPGPASAGQSTLSPTSQAIGTASGDFSTITVTIKDSHGNVISGDTVQLKAGTGNNSLIALGSGGTSGGVAGFTGVSGVTSSNGTVTFSISDSTAESVTYTATVTSDPQLASPLQITTTASATFQAGAPSGAQSTLTTSATTQTIGQNVTLTVTIKDGSGNPVSGKTVKLTTSGGSATITGSTTSCTTACTTTGATSGPTSSSGQVTFTSTDTAVESVTYSATDTTDNVAVNQTVSVSFQPGALGSFVFSNVPPTVVAGTPFSITVTAKDTGGNTKTDYTGTSFAFSATGASNSPSSTACSGSPCAPSVPATATFTNGVASISITFYNASDTPMLNATDGTVVAHSSAISVDPAPPQAPFFTVTPDALTQPASTAFTVTVTAQADAYGNTGYLGTVHFTSSDTNPAVVLPPDYTFQPSDNGSHVFSVTLITVTSSASATITVTDTSNANIHASSSGITVISAGAAVDLLLVKQTTQVAGNAFYVTVRADDGHGNTITTFTNKVTLWPCSETCDGKTAGNGPNAIPMGLQKPLISPSTWTYKAADNGSHTFKVTFRQAGAQQLTAISCDPRYANGVIGTLPSSLPCPAPSAASGPNVLGNTNVTVLPVNPIKLSITTNLPPSNPLKPTLPPVTTANVPFNVTVNVLDKFGNIVTSNAVDSKTPSLQVAYTHAVHFTSTDVCTTTRTFCAVLPADYTFTATDNGSHTFTGGVTLKTAGTKSIKVTDATCVPVTTSCKPPAAFSKSISVTPNTAVNFLLTPGTAGTTTRTHNSKFSVTVKAVDAVLNVVPTYTGTVHVANAGADSATEPVCAAAVPLVSGVPQVGSCVPVADTTFLATYKGVHPIGIVLPNKSTISDPNTTVTFSDSTNHISATATFVLS
jgi:hypothetical protein